MSQANRKQMAKAIKQFSDAYNEINKLWVEGSEIDLNDTEAIRYYPFNKAFEDLKIPDWCKATFKELILVSTWYLGLEDNVRYWAAKLDEETYFIVNEKTREASVKNIAALQSLMIVGELYASEIAIAENILLNYEGDDVYGKA